MKILENLKNNNKARKVKEIEERAEELFQLQEHCGELWFSVNGWPIMPTSFFKSDPLSALKEIRELYIKERITQI